MKHYFGRVSSRKPLRLESKERAAYLEKAGFVLVGTAGAAEEGEAGLPYTRHAVVEEGAVLPSLFLEE